MALGLPGESYIQIKDPKGSRRKNISRDSKVRKFTKKTPTLRVSWRDNFLAFNEQHGGHPVDFKGRLLYRDGWTHSTTDYKGPAYPPPQDMIECRNLKRYYWQIRRRALLIVLGATEEQISALVEMQEVSGIPPVVWTKIYVYDEELDKEVPKMEPLPINWQTVMDQREDIKADIQQCQEYIERYTI